MFYEKLNINDVSALFALAGQRDYNHPALAAQCYFISLRYTFIGF